MAFNRKPKKQILQQHRFEEFNQNSISKLISLRSISSVRTMEWKSNEISLSLLQERHRWRDRLMRDVNKEKPVPLAYWYFLKLAMVVSTWQTKYPGKWGKTWLELLRISGHHLYVWHGIQIARWWTKFFNECVKWSIYFGIVTSKFYPKL